MHGGPRPPTALSSPAVGAGAQAAGPTRKGHRRRFTWGGGSPGQVGHLGRWVTWAGGTGCAQACGKEAGQEALPLQKLHSGVPTTSPPDSQACSMGWSPKPGRTEGPHLTCTREDLDLLCLAQPHSHTLQHAHHVITGPVQAIVLHVPAQASISPREPRPACEVTPGSTDDVTTREF